jgi:cysteine synthase
MAEHPGAFWPQQYSNPHNPRAYATLAQELLEDVDHIDILVGSVGSGGSLCGTARALRQTHPELLVVAVDAVSSAIFGQPDNPRRLQSGLGNSLVPPNVDRGVINQVHWLNDEEAFAATLRLAYDEQIFAGNSSGSAYWVARWLNEQHAPDATTVVILPDRGDRYYRTFYDHEYLEEHNIARLSLPDAPLEVQFGQTVNSWSYATLAEQCSALEEVM